MTETPATSAIQRARKRLLYIFVPTGILWLILLPLAVPTNPCIIVSMLIDLGLFFGIWHGAPFAKFLAVPLFLFRGICSLLVTLVAIGASMDQSGDAGANFLAAMLYGLIPLTIYFLGAGVALIFVPNIAETKKTGEFYAEMRAKMERLKVREAARDAAANEKKDSLKDIPSNAKDVPASDDFNSSDL